MSAYLSKLKYTIAITSVLFLMFGILNPLEIFSGNQQEFEFGFHDFFWFFLGIYGVIWIVGSSIIALLPNKICQFFNLTIFVISIECYLQNMFMNRALMNSNGDRLKWEGLKSYTIINTVCWIVIAIIIVVLFIILKSKWNEISSIISLCVTGIQLIAVVSLIFSVPRERTYNQECKIDATEQFALASQDNIIVFVLDRYANDQFNTNLENHPEMKTVLKDFTYYDNANSIFENTGNALTVMLAGQVAESIKEDRTAIWGRKKVQNFYDTLHAHGYETFITSRDNNISGDMKAFLGKYDNVKALDVELDTGLMFRLLTKMSIYKVAPYIIKPKFEVLTYSFTDVLHPENYKNSYYLCPEFYQGLVNERFYINDSVDKLFKVQHIQGMHGDYNMDANAMEIPEKDGTVEQSRDGLNVIIEEYLNQLKELGVYDNATIIITADHGDDSGEFGLQPTVLIKRSGETNDTMQVNSAPISHEDFIPTILYYLGEDYTDYGTTIYDWHEGDTRERVVRLTNGEEYIYYTNGEELEQIVNE